MNLSGNTILITGGGSGIGRGLAEALHKAGNQVIIAGRRKAMLDETTSANQGMKSLVLDIEHRDGIRSVCERVSAEFPSLNVLINNAGIMRAEKLLEQQDDLAAVLEGLGQFEVARCRRRTALAFVPLVYTPTYCATKAAIHSYTQSLRYQLKATKIEVLELIPPYVATDLMSGRSDPRAMPLDKFLEEVMSILKARPTPSEICVENVKGLRLAMERGQYDAVFSGLNSRMADIH